MKYFTRQWASGALSDVESARITAAYQAHIAALLPRLSESVAQLAERTDLHDGLFRQVLVDRGAGALTLALRGGDLQAGYYDLDLTYTGVVFANLDMNRLATLARDRRTEILYDEVDLAPGGRYVHRLICHPAGELAVNFTHLQLRRIARADRDISPAAEPYQAIE